MKKRLITVLLLMILGFFNANAQGAKNINRGYYVSVGHDGPGSSLQHGILCFYDSPPGKSVLSTFFATTPLLFTCSETFNGYAAGTTPTGAVLQQQDLVRFNNMLIKNRSKIPRISPGAAMIF